MLQASTCALRRPYCSRVAATPVTVQAWEVGSSSTRTYIIVAGWSRSGGEDTFI